MFIYLKLKFISSIIFTASYAFFVVFIFPFFWSFLFFMVWRYVVSIIPSHVCFLVNLLFFYVSCRWRARRFVRLGLLQALAILQVSPINAGEMLLLQSFLPNWILLALCLPFILYHELFSVVTYTMNLLVFVFNCDSF